MPHMITTAELDAIVKAGKPTDGEYKAWFAWLKHEHGTEDLPADVEAKLYAYAWEHGHSSGFSDVAYWYGELSELVLYARRVR